MKKLILLGTVIFFLFAISSIGQAAVTVTVEKLTESDQSILPGSGKTGIFKIGVKSDQPGTETFNSCSISFLSYYGFSAGTDLLTIGNYTQPTAGNFGLTLYQNSTYNQPVADAIFDESDFAYACNLGGSYTLTLSPALTLAEDVQYTFFVVIKTSDDIQSIYYGSTDERDKFTATGTLFGVSDTTDTITCESRVVDLVPIRSDMNEYTNASNTYYPGDYPGDPEYYRYKWFIPEENEEPNTDWYYEMAISELASTDTYIAVLGLDVAAPRGCLTTSGVGDEYLNSVKVTFTAGGAGVFNPAIDIRDITLWKDANNNGIFDSSIDTRISGYYGGGWTVTLYPSSTEIIDPIVDSPAVVDYFVVIRTTIANHGLDFKVSIEPGDVNFSVADPSGDATGNPNLGGLCRGLNYVKSINSILQMHDLVHSPGLVEGKIDATSSPIPVLGINVTDGDGYTDTIQTIKVTFSGTGFTPNDLANLCNGLSSGVSLWKDNKEEGRIGTFDPTRSRKDTLVPIHIHPWVDEGGGEWSVLLCPQTALDVPNDDRYQGSNRGDDFFICVRTSDTIDYLDTIKAEIKTEDIQFGGAKSSVGSPNAPPHPHPLTANVNVSLTNMIPQGKTMARGERIFCIEIYVKKPTAAVSLASLVCQIVDRGDGNLDITDLADLSADPGTSGIAIYKKTAAGFVGLLLSGIPELITDPFYDTGFLRVKLVLNSPDVIGPSGNTYRLLIRTSNTLDLKNDDFSIRLWGSGIDVLTGKEGGKALGFADGSRTYEKLETNILGPTPVGDFEAPPGDLNAVPGVNAITLRWDDKSTGETGFQIERKIAGTNDNTYEIVGTTGEGVGGFATYTDFIMDDEIDDTYTYRVRAYIYREVGDPPTYEYLYTLWSGEVSAASYTFTHLIGEGGGGTGCFIATAAFGTPMAEEVKTLCKFRDDILLKYPLGRNFVKLYYTLSPPIADFIRNKPLLKAIVRMQLKPLVWWSRCQ